MKTFALAVLLLIATTAFCETKVVVFGDSLSAGFGLEKAAAFPAVLEQLARAQGHQLTVFNAGVSGDTSAGGLRRLDWSLRQPFDVFLLELGANDGLRGIDLKEIHKNLQAIIDKVRAKNPKARIIIAGMTLPPNLGQAYIREFEAVFRQLAAKNQAILIPFLLEGVAGRPELNQSDGIHPTEEGHRRIAKHVLPFLLQALDGKGRESRGEPGMKTTKSDQ